MQTWAEANQLPDPEESATKAAEDVIQVSQLEQLATKTDIGRLETNIAKQESRLIKWMVGSLSVFATIIVTLG